MSRKNFIDYYPIQHLYWIEECGHAAMMEHPDKFNEILDEWLTTKAEHKD